MKQIVLLRGINIGPRNRIAMADLRELFTSVGFVGVRSYVQSGNVVLDSEAPPERVARECERQIADRFDLDIAVVTRTRDELAEVVERNPLGEMADEPKRYQVSFCSEELPAAKVEQLSALAVEPERFLAIGRELYAWHPHGVARSRLWARLADRKLGVTATARNWTTVTKLLAMANE